MHEILDEIERVAELCRNVIAAVRSAMSTSGVSEPAEPRGTANSGQASASTQYRSAGSPAVIQGPPVLGADAGAGRLQHLAPDVNLVIGILRAKTIPQLESLVAHFHDEGLKADCERIVKRVDYSFSVLPHLQAQFVRSRLAEASAEGVVGQHPDWESCESVCNGLAAMMITWDALPQINEDLLRAVHRMRTKVALIRGGGATKSAGQESDQPASTTVHHHHGDTHMGSTFTTNITGSTVGALAQGDHSVATGHVTVGAAGTLTQEQHKTAISAAQTALVHDQDALERIDDRLYEALGQFLTLARKIQVEQQSLVEVQAQMKATLDEVWAQQEAKGMKSKLLPKGLEVVEVLAKSPITAEIAKKLLGA